MYTTKESPAFCYEELSERCLGNEQLIERVLEAFQQGAAKDLESLSTFVESSDFSAAARTVHRMKGSALNSGAYHMSTIASQMERELARNETDDLAQACVQLKESFAEFRQIILVHHAPTLISSAAMISTSENE